VLAHAAVVPRALEVDGRPLRTGYLEAVATDRSRQGEGLGSLVLADATALVRSEYELGALSSGLHAFYARHGWERWRGPTYARHGAETVRTADDDDGVMVLRFGPSAAIDLTAPLSCEGRRGDDW
jgi:aminoglycoside 2'-N-acetyltransferase I